MEQLITDYFHYVGFYVYAALFVWLLNSFVAGFNGVGTNKDDFIQSILWPISIATLLGMLVKIIIIKIKERNNG
jgi:hypothetical protein